jgi:hypothetical protein
MHSITNTSRKHKFFFPVGPAFSMEPPVRGWRIGRDALSASSIHSITPGYQVVMGTDSVMLRSVSIGGAAVFVR